MSHKIKLKAADMPDLMQNDAVEFAKSAMSKHKEEKDIARAIKEDMDRRHSPTWHCVVGKNFGSFVTHEAGNFMYFYVDNEAILLFKSV
ncbi:unnamed protein product [Gordionus sp. m RMFG-2023]|uniref:dynein light chain-like n=1 Tax=Gordionus sp. m RMFG-2023 TaxID=3053472 RepID=UPI0030E3FA88